MQKSAFLCDYLKEQNQTELGMITPDSMIDERAPGSGGKLIQITAADNTQVATTANGQPNSGMSVPMRNMLISIGAGVAASIIIYLIFHSDE